MPEVKLNIESETIVAKTRKLKASWTYDTQADLGHWAANNQAAVDMLTASLAQEIQDEIDREILEELKNNSLKPWGFKKKKKKEYRSIKDDWEIQNLG